MSDHFDNDAKKPLGRPSGANPWERDPFAPYDDPALDPATTGVPLEDAHQENAAKAAPYTPDYSAWRRPGASAVPPAPPAPPAPAERAPAQPAAGNPYARKPDFTAAPPYAAPPYAAPPAGMAAEPRDLDFGIVAVERDDAAFGAGRPPYPEYGLPTPQGDSAFAALGADAPTRIARPVGQIVNKHVTPDRGAPGSFTRPDAPAARPPAFPVTPEESAEDDGAPRRRRASRAARHSENAEFRDASDMPPSQRAPQQAAVLPPEGREARPEPEFDPFEAGDSEIVPPEPEQGVPETDATPRPVRRPTAPGERYTGARTALPQSGAPLRREPLGEVATGQPNRPLPQRQPGAPGQPPARLDADGRPIPPQRLQGAPGQVPPGQRPVRLDADGRPIPPQRPQGAPGQVPPGQPPVRLDADGRPIPPQRPQGVPGQVPPQGMPGQRPVRLDANGRPIPPQRPQGVPGQVPPQGMPGQRPVRLDANGRPISPQRPQGAPGQVPPRMAQEGAYAPQGAEGIDPRRRLRTEEEQPEANRFDPRRAYPEMRPRASVERDPYDFEEDGEEVRPRRGAVLIPLLTILLVLGSLLAGIVLPDWDGMGGGLGTAMGKIKGAVVGVFGSVKGLISPEAAGVRSITVSPASATAPVELVFVVQASASVTDIRIVDQFGTELLQKTLTDSDLLSGDVQKNSNGNIWTLRYTCETAYAGTYTAQTLKKDGAWDEGMTLTEAVSIAPPAVVEPPVQDFETDTVSGVAPATVGFTVVTSLDVTGVQILNDYGDPVAEAALTDAQAAVAEGESTLTWTLNAQMADPYTGSFFAAYETKSDDNFTQSDYSVDVTLTAEGEEEPALDTDASLSSLTDGDAEVPAADEPDAALTADATEVPVAVAQATVEATATPAPEATPAATPLPLLTATADEAAAPSALKLDTKAYEETKEKSPYERTKKIVMNDPFLYAVWKESGVLTFRSGPFRQNSAYGTVNMEKKQLTELWKMPMEGSIKAKSATLTGVSWPGQAIIVKWPTQLRTILALNDAAKNKQALKEVIVGAQNGKIYFVDLITGEQTREPIDNSWPSNGVLSLQTNASPMLAVGQHIGVLATKTVDNGLHLYNLMDNKELTMLKGKEKLMRSNYSGVNGAPLFDKTTGTMVVGGQNGILYTMEPSDEFDHVLATLKITPAFQRYTWLAGKQKAKSTNIDGAVAMYGPYAYFGDQSGIVQCVDVNTLSPVWAVDTGDNVDATVALDMENETTVSLYTANTILNQGRTGVCTIRKLDALTGKQLWTFTVPDLAYTTEAEVGVYASPVVGGGKISDWVYFTATNGTKGATLYALNKQSGSVAWTLALSTPTVSSPVAVYNDAGDAWIVQAEGGGKLHLLDAKTGTEVNTLQLEGNVESTPAVYRDVLVVGTTGSSSNLYGIKLE